MLSAIKKLFSKPSAGRSATQRSDALTSTPSKFASAASGAAPTSTLAPPGRSAAPMPGASKSRFGKRVASGTSESSISSADHSTAAPPALATAAGDSDSVTLPMSAIIQSIPKELHGKLAPAGAAGCNFTMPKAQVIEQLPRGAVRVPFGELRRTAPSGLFTNSHASDGQMVDLPLSQILAQLRPEDYSFRSHRQTEKPSEEICDLFGENGECLTTVRLLGKDEILKPSPEIAAKRQPFSPPPTVSPISSPPAFALPASPIRPAPPDLPRPAQTSAIPMPRLQVKPAVPEVPIVPVSTVNPALSAAATASFKEQIFLVALDNIAAGWPEEIRQEIARFQIPHVKCAFPPAEICSGLMAGKMQFTWDELRAKTHPAPLQLEPSDHGETVLELPLNIITPLFLEFIRSSSGDSKAIDPQHTTMYFRKAQETTEFFKKTSKPAVSTPASGPPAPKTPPPQSAQQSPATTSFRKKSHTARLTKAAADSKSEGVLTISLSLVSSSWPPLVLKEIQQFNLSESKIEMPLDAVEPGLKRGKIEVSWKQVCSWLKPQSPEALKSHLGGTPLALPLSVVAPLYLQQRPAPSQHKMSSELASIPDVFASTKPTPPVAMPAAAEASVDVAPEPPELPQLPEAPPEIPVPVFTAAPVAESRVADREEHVVSRVPTPAPTAKQPENIAELFGEPQKRNWTPKEIVQKAAELEGVIGALIVLQDGLLVASCTPPGCKTETIAAFLPQIMGRMNQYAKEFKMGDLGCVALTVEEATIRIYNAGIIYFAALGRPEGELPTAALRLIASELGRHTK